MPCSVFGKFIQISSTQKKKNEWKIKRRVMLANQTISATYTKCRKTPCAQCYSLVSRHTTIDFSLCFAFAVVCLFRHAVYTKVEMRNNNEKKIPSIPFKIYFSMVERKKKKCFFFKVESIWIFANSFARLNEAHAMLNLF